MSDQATTPKIEKIVNGDVVAWFGKIGPEKAKSLLDTYKVDYRKYRPTYAEGLARDMESGHWNFDGSPVRIDIEGNLFDGQHRLHAVILSGSSQDFLIVSGLPVKAYDTTDTGLPRNYGDNLRRRGYSNVQLRGALIKLIHRWQTGKSLDDTKRLTNSELDAIHDRYVDSINRAIEMAMSTHRKTLISPALMAFAWWILTRIDNEKAYTFLVSLAEGENLRRGMPVFTLRERLRLSSDDDFTRNETMHLIFSAWNAFVEGKEITRLSLPRGYVTRERMVIPREAA